MTLTKMRRIDTRLTLIEQRQTKFEQKIGLTEKRVIKLENELIGREDATDEVIAIKVEEAFEEWGKRSKRQYNLLVHKFNECNSENPQVRKEHDISGCLKIFKDHCFCRDIGREDIENLVRIGKKKKIGNQRGLG